MKDNQIAKEHSIKEVTAKDKKQKALNNMVLVNTYNEQMVLLQS